MAALGVCWVCGSVMVGLCDGDFAVIWLCGSVYGGLRWIAVVDMHLQWVCCF